MEEETRPRIDRRGGGEKPENTDLDRLKCRTVPPQRDRQVVDASNRSHDENDVGGLSPFEMIIIGFESGLHHLVVRYVDIFVPSIENGFL